MEAGLIRNEFNYPLDVPIRKFPSGEKKALVPLTLVHINLGEIIINESYHYVLLLSFSLNDNLHWTSKLFAVIWTRDILLLCVQKRKGKEGTRKLILKNT